jgi:HJR/Mrr/RecB family endonuclease
MSESERNLTQKTLSEVTETLTSTVDVNKKGNLVKPLTELSRHLDQWTAFIHPQKEVALWNLNKIEHCRSQVAKVAGRRSTFEKCRIEDLEPALLAFSRLAESAPSTYYQLGKSLNVLFARSSIPSLARLTPGSGPITRLVTATVPLYRLLRRDLDAIFRMDPEAFEEFVAECLERMGMVVRRTGSTYSSDGGVDLIASPRLVGFPFLLAVQVKHHRDRLTKTGPGPVKDMQAVLGSLPFHAGMIVTNTSFTPDAEWWASFSAGKLQLHDIRSIRNWIEERYELDRFRNIPSAIQLTPRLKVEVWREPHDVLEPRDGEQDRCAE